MLTTDFYPTNNSGFHDPNYVLTLSLDAASYLVNDKGINLYGTSWKSTDFMPGKMERPIHKKIFEKAVILEMLDLKSVPAGEYFLVAYPLMIEGASESPVTALLFTKAELSSFASLLNK